MPKSLQTFTARESSRRRPHGLIFLLMTFGIVSSLAATVTSWRASVLEPGDQICVKDEGCRPSCAEIEPGSICAELTHPSGYVLSTCCIPEQAVNTNDPNACLELATILREGGPIE